MAAEKRWEVLQWHKISDIRVIYGSAIKTTAGKAFKRYGSNNKALQRDLPCLLPHGQPLLPNYRNMSMKKAEITCVQDVTPEPFQPASI